MYNYISDRYLFLVYNANLGCAPFHQFNVSVLRQILTATTTSSDFYWFVFCTIDLFDQFSRSPWVSDIFFHPELLNLHLSVTAVFKATSYIAKSPHMRMPNSVSVRQLVGLCQLASFSQYLTILALPSTLTLLTARRSRDFHPLENVHAMRTKKQ